MKQGGFRYNGVNIKEEKGKIVIDQDMNIGGMQIPKLKRFRKKSALMPQELTEYSPLAGKLN